MTDVLVIRIKLNNEASWNRHATGIILLKRSGLQAADIIFTYKSFVRPIAEYAAEVFHTSLTIEQSDLLESIQKRACSIAHPGLAYTETLKIYNMKTLAARREEKCKKLFSALQQRDHKLHHLLPPEREVTYSLRKKTKYQAPTCNTDRRKNSFLNWCLANAQ